jgi:hypothetical protein
MKTKITTPLRGGGTLDGSGSVLNILLAVLCILLIISVSTNLYTKYLVNGGGGGGGGSGGTGGERMVDDITIYPPRQLPMMFSGGNGVAWPPNVLQNPYAAPMKDERYLVGPPMVPINVSTNPGAVDSSYRQVGILSPNSGGRMGGRDCKKCKLGQCDGSCGSGGLNNGGSDDLLILMGRPLFTNRDTWQYYAISNQRNGVKLPVRVGGKNATNEYGVRELYGGEVITVEGYNRRYRVEMYETDTIRYLPYM